MNKIAVLLLVCAVLNGCASSGTWVSKDFDKYIVNRGRNFIRYNDLVHEAAAAV